MASFEEELLQDAADDAREIAYFRTHLPADVTVKFSDADMQFILDKIIEYYATSGVFDVVPAKGKTLEIDEEKVAEYVLHAAEKEKCGPFQKEDVLQIVILEADYDE